MARNSFLVSTPIFWSIIARAIEPTMSCCHNRQSKETDSVNWVTSVPGARAKRPLRETGELFFILLEFKLQFFRGQAEV